MGFLGNLAAGLAKSVVPKILVGGTSADKKSVQTFVKSGAADPVFQKFGSDLEKGVKVAGAITAAALTLGAAGVGAADVGKGSSLISKLVKTPGSTANSSLPALSSATNTGGISIDVGPLSPDGGGGIGAVLGLNEKIVNSSQPVGLLDTLTKGINKVDAFSQTTFGKNLIGTLGTVVSNLATPGGSKPSTVPQSLALSQGNIIPPRQTAAQAAVFDGKGITVDIKKNGETWWDKNKSWAMPALLAVPGFFITLVLLLGKRRR